MNREQIKYIAVLTMLLNHIALILLPEGTVQYYVLDCVGHFTAPVMVYFLVEGYYYTSSRASYGKRLFCFALLSQLPFYLAFRADSELISLNFLFTLLICFCIVHAWNTVLDPVWRQCICLGLVTLTLICDWFISAAVLTLALCFYKIEKKKILLCFGYTWGCYLLVHAVELLSNWSLGYSYLLSRVGINLLNSIPLLLAGLVIRYLYNGKKSGFARAFSKWFFYLFYPAHLLLLVWIRDGGFHL